ncbi:MAG TPA: hypothetical protein QGF02_01055 [Candidatus Babeliales bacterium]|nr:hypothetical protein [Candidatus Babeliales bacterium]
MKKLIITALSLCLIGSSLEASHIAPRCVLFLLQAAQRLNLKGVLNTNPPQQLPRLYKEN